MFDFLARPELNPAGSLGAAGGGGVQLPLDIISIIISVIDSPSDLSRISRSCRIYHFLTVPQLYRSVAITCRREGRRSSVALAQMGALLKPGIASCVRRLEVAFEDDSSPESSRRSEECGLWAVAVVGVLVGMIALEEFLWNSESMMHPILYEWISRCKTLKSLRVTHPISLHPPPPPLPLSASPPIKFENLRRLHLTGLGPRTTYNWSWASMPALQVLKASWRVPARLAVAFADHGRRPRRLRELHLGNMVLDRPLRNCVQWCELERLSLLDCRSGGGLSWNDVLKPQKRRTSRSSLVSASSSSPAAAPPTAGSPTGGTPGTPTTPKRQLVLKSLRINDAGSHWTGFLASFSGLEELYVLPGPDQAGQDQVTGEAFLDAVIGFHATTIRNLRLSAKHKVHKERLSMLARACSNLEELALQAGYSGLWKSIDPSLSRVRVFQHLSPGTRSPAEEGAEFLAIECEIEHLAATGEGTMPPRLEMLAFGSRWAWVADRTAIWTTTKTTNNYLGGGGGGGGEGIAKGRIMRIDDLRERVGIWKAEEGI